MSSNEITLNSLVGSTSWDWDIPRPSARSVPNLSYFVMMGSRLEGLQPLPRADVDVRSSNFFPYLRSGAGNELHLPSVAVLAGSRGVKIGGSYNPAGCIQTWRKGLGRIPLPWGNKASPVCLSSNTRSLHSAYLDDQLT